VSQVPNPFNTFQDPYSQNQSQYGYGSQADAGAVARFFNAVYAWMFAGLALTAVVAWYVSQNTQILEQIGRGIWVLFIVELVLVGVIGSAINRISASVATILFLLYAAINGVVFSVIFLMYAHSTLASAFAITAGMFGAMSLYGFITRRDLTGIGSMAFMALIGLIIASVVSMFWHNSLLNVAINYVGVLIFVGLTAYQTQALKGVAMQTSGNPNLAARLAISGALTLYLSFLNLFLFILQIMGSGDRRR
jgi:hypothetical protein